MPFDIPGCWRVENAQHSPKRTRRVRSFTQPDSIVPDMTNTQALNRYTYVNNNPVNRIDPTGHWEEPSRPCLDNGYCGIPGIGYEKHVYSSIIEERYQWTLSGNWTLDELRAVYKTGKDIETYVDNITNGMGKKWMNEYMGNITIEITEKRRGSALPGKIDLPEWWDGSSKYYEYYLAHELAHI